MKKPSRERTFKGAGKAFWTAHCRMNELAVQQRQGKHMHRETLERAARDVILAAVALADMERELARWRRDGRQKGFFKGITSAG